MIKSEKTKVRIINAGTVLFSKQGYGNTSTKEIARLAEVSEATLFKHFKSKDGLFKAILFSLIAEIKKISVIDIGSIILAKHKSNPLYHVLSEIIDNRIKFLDQHDSTIKAIIQEALINTELKEQIQDTVWPEINSTLTKLFDKAILSGEIAPRDTHYLVSGFFSAIAAPIIASYVVPSYDNSTRTTYIKGNFELFYTSLVSPQKEVSYD